MAVSRSNTILLATVFGLALVIAALSVASARLGPTVDSFATAQLLDGTLVNSQLAITFTQPMNIPSVERSFRITPRVRGDFVWSGNQMRFAPSRNLAFATTYRITIGTRAQDSSGHHLTRPYRVSFTTETEHVMYIGTEGTRRDHLVIESLGGKSQIVGPDVGQVTDYSTSTDGSLVVYVRRGSSDERADEIWLLSLADNSTQRVFRRPDWDLSQPHFSPDGRYVVFLASNVQLCQKSYGCYRDTRPEIYLIDLHNRHVFPYRSKSDVPITDFIDFSPGGQLGFTDLGGPLTLSDPNGNHVVHVPNMGNSATFVGFAPAGERAVFVGQTPSSTGGDILVYDFKSGRYTDVSRGVYDSSTPAFSQSGNRVVYAAYRSERGIEPVYGVNVYDLKAGTTARLTSDTKLSDWTPVWSSDDRYLAFIRSVPQEAMYMGSGEIWVMRSDGREARPLGGIGRDVQWVM
jgi:Tol biopolymer transport system component